MKNIISKYFFATLALLFTLSVNAQYTNTIASNNDHVFAATTTGVYELTNNSTTWVEMNKGMGPLSVVSLFINGTSMYAGTAQNGLFVSKDNGNNWTAVNVGITHTTETDYPSVSAIAAEGTKVALLTADGDIFVSNDNGSTWKGGKKSKDAYLRIITILHGTIFAGVGYTSPSYEPYTSNDDGMTWKKVKGLEYNYIYSATAVGSSILVVGIEGLLSYSIETKKWTLINADLNEDGLVGVSGANVVIGEAYSLVVSADTGKTWRSIRTIDVADRGSKAGIFGSTIYYLFQGVVKFTTDDGANWKITKIGETVVVDKWVSSGNVDTYTYVGEKDGVALYDDEYAGVIFKVVNHNAYAVNVNIKVQFKCKSTTFIGGVEYQTQEIVWRIGCDGFSTKSYESDPAACSVGGCKDHTESWSIVEWTVTQ